jgi:PTH1 family peptidyl-tRNA hydrolase
MFEEYEHAKGTYRNNELVLIKPLTYMNNSGRVLRHVLKYHNAKTDDIMVICDNLDLTAGSCRLKLKGSSGGHKGLSSIIQYAGTQEFKRLFIGIGRPESSYDVIDYVLREPRGNDKVLIDEAIIRAAEYSLMLLEKNPQDLMNIINRRDISD